jgi:hypothetical protein
VIRIKIYALKCYGLPIKLQMCAFVALKEGENELRAIVTAIRTKGLRENWHLADQSETISRRLMNTPETLRGMVARETTRLEERVGPLCANSCHMHRDKRHN